MPALAGAIDNDALDERAAEGMAWPSEKSACRRTRFKCESEPT